MHRKLLLLAAAAVVGMMVVPGTALAGEDPDGDGKYNWYDECDWLAEDYDGWYDGDGCPEDKGIGGGGGGDCPQECLATIRPVGGL